PHGLPYGYIPSTFVIVHAVSVGYVVTGFHVLCFLYVRHLFKQQTARIQALMASEKKHLAEALKREIRSYMRLGEALHTINETLKMHLLARVLLTVPRLVFSLWYIEHVLPRPLEILGAVHDSVNTVVELAALVVIPASVHSAIKEGEAAICRNTHFWTPCDERLFLRAQTLLSLAKQSDFGISLGGVTVITLPLLWTLVTLLITFLTFFSDVRQAPRYIGGAFSNSSNSA
ncbi:Protein GUR-5, partial [Aphelenchoides avenae]